MNKEVRNVIIGAGALMGAVILAMAYKDVASIEVVEHEGCEYIFYKKGDLFGQALSHKGNCTNDIHIYENDTVIANDTTKVKELQ